MELGAVKQSDVLDLVCAKFVKLTQNIQVFIFLTWRLDVMNANLIKEIKSKHKQKLQNLHQQKEERLMTEVNKIEER